jgi:hypothetical protein
VKYKFTTSENVSICFDELTLNGYKQIIKASYGDDISFESLSSTIASVLAEHSNKSSDFFETLNLCDLMDILIEVRSNSMGNISTILVPDDEGKQIKVDLRLDWIQEDLRSLISFCNEQSVLIENMKLVYGCPSLNKLLTNLNDNEQFLSFLQKAEIDNSGKRVIFDINNISDAKRVLDAVSAKEGNQIVEKFYKIAEFMNSQDTLVRYKIKTNEKLKFIPNLNSFVWFIKLMYNDSLDSIYNNIFMLAKHGNISPDYLEKCTPGEYMFFVKKLEQDFLEQQEEQPQGIDLN